LFVVLALAFWTSAGLLASLGLSYFGLLGAIAAHFTWQIAFLKPDDQANCLAKFKANAQVGWLLLAGIIVGHLY
jgi:4-hydroxybenzoate polyprenyltransferase